MGKYEAENHAWVSVGEEVKGKGERCMRLLPSDYSDSKREPRSYSDRPILETRF